jgi:ferrous iron transport protein B
MPTTPLIAPSVADAPFEHSTAPCLDVMLVNYGPEIEAEIAALQCLLETDEILRTTYSPRWLALALLEGDTTLDAQIARVANAAEIRAQIAQAGERVAGILGDEIDTLIADRRYRFIADLVHDAVNRPASANFTRSDQVDRVATHPWLGVPLFLVLMWFVFQMTANVSSIYVDWIDGVLTGPFARWVVAILGWAGLGGSWFESLLVDGVIAGAGGVLVFVPVLIFLYFFIALLEDSGYMARAAFVMDRFMQMLGLHGKSFIPLLVGFGCSVPGIYATRTLEDRRDRILTGLLVPFMSCAARLPVYVLIGTAFFGANSGNLVFAMYLVGVLVAVLSGLVFRRTLFRRTEDLPFIMELPAFRRPSFKTIERQTRQRTMGFVRSVWTVIMMASVAVWILLNIPYQNGQPPELKNSLFSDVSRTISPAFAPNGFGNWEATGSLVTGLVAKEVVVGTMSQIYAAEATKTEDEAETPTFLDDAREIVAGFVTAALDTVKATVSVLPGVDLMPEESEEDNTALQAALRQRFTPLQAVAFSVFVLLYTPCMATVGAIRHEFGTRWMWFSMVYMLGIAWLASALTYQIGTLLGLG